MITQRIILTQKILVATRLEEKTHGTLKALAESRDRTLSYLVRKAVEQYVEAATKRVKKGDK